MRALSPPLLVAALGLITLVPPTPAQDLLGFGGAPLTQPTQAAQTTPPVVTAAPLARGTVPAVTWYWKQDTGPVVPAATAGGFDPDLDTPAFRDLGATDASAPALSEGLCRLVQRWYRRFPGSYPFVPAQNRPSPFGEPALARDPGELAARRLRAFSQDPRGREVTMKLARILADDGGVAAATAGGQAFREIRTRVTDPQYGTARFTFRPVDGGRPHTLLAYRLQPGLAVTDAGHRMRAVKVSVYDPGLVRDSRTAAGLDARAYLLYFPESERWAFPRAYLQAWADAGSTWQDRAILRKDQVLASPRPTEAQRTAQENSNGAQRLGPEDPRWDWEAACPASPRVQAPAADAREDDPELAARTQRAQARRRAARRRAAAEQARAQAAQLAQQQATEKARREAEAKARADAAARARRQADWQREADELRARCARGECIRVRLVGAPAS